MSLKVLKHDPQCSKNKIEMHFHLLNIMVAVLEKSVVCPTNLELEQ